MFVKKEAAKPAGKLSFADLALTVLPGAWYAGGLR